MRSTNTLEFAKSPPDRTQVRDVIRLAGIAVNVDE
jgi:hypothetical protein